ncbi:acyltransferase family protein [Micromonospora zhanjiangensis]|uniref:Acyltransferase family protein n=1 Tax=Micromonospora zhanjiangensis TaxID=1522057 RepID=A0ABV8KT17_9ACTN
MATTPLATAYTGRANSFGFLRLCFAFAVVLAHAAVLGFNRGLTDLVDIPGLAVAGFFGISGFLITRSARRTSLPRYLWHRALRIWPGLWVCLLFIGFVVAPTFYYLKHGGLHTLWRGNRGVLDYLQANWWGGHRQGGIRDVFRDTPYGAKIKSSMMDASLWTLAYEILCYLIVALLAVVGVLKRARWLVLLAAVATFGLLCWNQWAQLRFGLPAVRTSGYLPELPLLGTLSTNWLLRYGFMFLVGAAAELYSRRLPMNDVLGVASLAVIGWFAFHGQLFGPALLAYEYAILYLAIRLPRVLHRVGQRNDYSYGVYIYSFVVQQALAWAGVQAIGFLGYFAASAALSLGFAFVSWHLVEKQALKLKDWQPRLRRSDRDAEGSPPADGSSDPAAVSTSSAGAAGGTVRPVADAAATGRPGDTTEPVPTLSPSTR